MNLGFPRMTTTVKWCLGDKTLIFHQNNPAFYNLRQGLETLSVYKKV